MPHRVQTAFLPAIRLLRHHTITMHGITADQQSKLRNYPPFSLLISFVVKTLDLILINTMLQHLITLPVH